MGFEVQTHESPVTGKHPLFDQQSPVVVRETDGGPAPGGSSMESALARRNRVHFTFLQFKLVIGV
jgi:hypothetical protein